MSDEDAFDSDHMQCRHCGKWIYVDSPQCPSCKNYTSDLGEFDSAPRSDQRLPLIWVIAGWLALIGMVVPIVLAVYYHFRR